MNQKLEISETVNHHNSLVDFFNNFGKNMKF